MSVLLLLAGLLREARETIVVTVTTSKGPYGHDNSYNHLMSL